MLLAIPTGFEPVTIGLEGRIGTLFSFSFLAACRNRVAVS